MQKLSLLIWVFVLLGMVSCGEPLTPRACAKPSTPLKGLRDAAQGCGLVIRAAVDAKPLRSDSTYAETLAREFSILTPENALKWETLRPSRDKYDFSDADIIVNFAATNKMQVRGHTLVWHESLPRWLSEGKFSRDELTTILRDHIMTVVGHYRGRIYAWDVVNEAIADDGSSRETIWSKGIGENYIDLAFQWAHDADPQVKLFYNDDKGEASGPKSNAIYNLVQGMKKRGVPIDGVGLQSHFDLNSAPKAQDVAANMNRLAALSLEVHITEIEVRLPAAPTQENLEAQARVYRDMLSACLAVQNCKAFVMWGFTDKYSSVPQIAPGKDAALIFDSAYRPKPAQKMMSDLLNQSK